MRERYSQLSRGEAIAVWIWLPVDLLLLPLLAGFAYARGLVDDMTANLAIYALGTLVLAVALHRFLGADFVRLFRRPLTLLLVPAAFFAQRFFELIIAVIVYMLDLGGNLNNEAVIDLLGSDPIPSVVMAVVLGPFVEECLFRAGIFGQLRRRSRFLAYLVSMLAFALSHVWQGAISDFTQLFHALSYLPAGFALAWIYERSDSIWGSWLLHALSNGVSVLTILWAA